MSMCVITQCLGLLHNVNNSCEKSRCLCWQGAKSWSQTINMHNHVLNQIAEFYQEREEPKHETCTNLKKAPPYGRGLIYFLKSLIPDQLPQRDSGKICQPTNPPWLVFI